MKAIGYLLFIGLFIVLFYSVGSFVVNALMTLIPASASDWFPFIRLVFWVVTFSFDLLVTFILYYIIIGLIGFIVGK